MFLGLPPSRGKSVPLLRLPQVQSSGIASLPSLEENCPELAPLIEGSAIDKASSIFCFFCGVGSAGQFSRAVPSDGGAGEGGGREDRADW